MTQRILALLLLLINVECGYAQTNKGHFTVALGCGPVSSGSTIGRFNYFGPDERYYQELATRFAPVLYGTARYFVGNRLDVGLTLAYQRQSGPVYRNDGNSLTEVGSLKRNAYTIAAEACLTYGKAQTTWYRIYSCLGIGYRYAEERGSYQAGYYTQHSYYLYWTEPWYRHESLPNIYYAPIGVRIGGKLAAHMELGIGYKGMVNGGVTLML